MYERTLPDFKAIIDTLHDRDDCIKALTDAYTKGYDAGYFDGKEFGWVDEMEKLSRKAFSGTDS